MDRYLVVYDDGSSRPSGQFVSSTGSLVGSPFIIGYGNFVGWSPSVCWDPSKHEFLVSWSGTQSYSNYSRRVSETGSPIGEAFQ